MKMTKQDPLLSVRDLQVDFRTPDGIVRVIDGVSFDIHPDEAFCIVGESGSGKSVTMLAVMGLLPRGARVTGGRILYRGRDLATLDGEAMRKIRGKDLAMVFQDPLTSLNPVIKIGSQIAEAVTLHNPGMSRGAVRRRVIELLEQVRLPNAGSRYSSYPHEFSGGMRQRVMIAMAMANHPTLLIADEPTTALDVTIQAQVLDLLRDMREEAQSAMVLITHDLGVVAETADQVMVMYSGRVMESGPVEQIFNRPQHPYTAGLMASMLRMDFDGHEAYTIKGQPPNAASRPSGCVFHPRCGLMRPGKCTEEVPPVRRLDGEREVACHHAEEVPAWIARDLPHLFVEPTSQGAP